MYGIVNIESGTLNVRSGAGLNYSVIGSLNKGDKVKLGPLVGDWYNIYYGQHGGFVYSKYIVLDRNKSIINLTLVEKAAIMIACDEGFSSEPYKFGVGEYSNSVGYGTYVGEFYSFPISREEAWNKLIEVLKDNYIPYCDKFITQYFGSSLTDYQKCAIYTFGYNLEGYVQDLVHRLSVYSSFEETFGRFLIPESLYNRRMRSWLTFKNNMFYLGGGIEQLPKKYIDIANSINNL